MLAVSDAYVNFNASSKAEDGTILAEMNAFYRDGDVVFGLTVKENVSDVYTDFLAFKDYVYARKNEMDAFLVNEIIPHEVGE